MTEREKKMEKGRTPSFAISCFTVVFAMSALSIKGAVYRTKGCLPGRSGKYLCESSIDLPLEAVKVITTTLPKMLNAIMPDITLGAMLGPNIAPKKTVAMSSLQSSLMVDGFEIASLRRLRLNLSTESLIERQLRGRVGS